MTLANLGARAGLHQRAAPGQLTPWASSGRAVMPRSAAREAFARHHCPAADQPTLPGRPAEANGRSQARNPAQLASFGGLPGLGPQWGPGLTQVLAGAMMAATAFPGSSMAAETAPPGFLELLLEFIEGLGPLGPAAYTALVCCCELIPLFPTQPLSLASGLLFGAQKGALCMCIGTTLAAAAAFGISRGMGKPLAEKLIEHELEELDGASGASSGKNSLQSKFHAIEEAIEHGSFWKQAGALFLLRLTPVVPFSASNYLLGLTPLPLAPYLAGTALGMGCWSVVYASLGGASRSLLAKGVSADALLADLLEKASEYTQEVATAGLLVAIAAAGAWWADSARKGVALPSQQQQQNQRSAGFVRPLLPGRKGQLLKQEEY